MSNNIQRRVNTLLLLIVLALRNIGAQLKLPFFTKPMNYLLKLILTLALSMGGVTFAMAAADTAAPNKSAKNNGSYQDIDRVIVVVNSNVITQQELNEQVRLITKQLQDAKRPVPPLQEMQRQVLEKLVIESVQFQEAKNRGVRVVDAELDSVIANIASQKKMTIAEYQALIEKSGQKFSKYKEDLRKEVMIARFREREVDAKIKISDSDVDNFIAERNRVSGVSNSPAASNNTDSIYLAQILVPVSENPNQEELNTAKAKAEKILGQASGENDFIAFANRLGKSDPTIRVVDLGFRTADRLPELFVQASASLKPGQLLPTVIQSPAGFHVLKLIDRKGAKGGSPSAASSTSGSILVIQNEVRHLLIMGRAGQIDQDVARRLITFRDQVRAKTVEFTALAKKYSEDKQSAANGGYIGWISPGQLPPEFDVAIASMQPGSVSDPIRTDYGWHLIQLLNRKQSELSATQQKDFAKASLRQSKLEQAYSDWIQELKSSATIEYRPPYDAK